MANLKKILGSSYRVQDVCDFTDVAMSINEIMDNCKLCHLSLYDVPAALNRVRGYAKLYLQEKYRNQADIEYCQNNIENISNIMAILDVLSEKYKK